MLLAVGSLGSMVGVLFATNMGGYIFFGIEGWRMAFHGVAGFSVLMGVAIWVLAVDPRCAGGGWKPTPMHPPAMCHDQGVGGAAAGLLGQVCLVELSDGTLWQLSFIGLPTVSNRLFCLL